MAILSGVLINFLGGKLHSALLHSCLNFQERNTNVKHGRTVHGDTRLFEVMLV